MAKLLTGKEVASALSDRIAERVGVLKKKNILPCLAILRCGENKSDISYEKAIIKKAELLGISTKPIFLPEAVKKDKLIEAIEEINRDTGVHGLIMFRPLPKGLREYEHLITQGLNPLKDMDGMIDASAAMVYTGRGAGFPPCTAEACIELLDYYGIGLEGKNVVVIGRSLVIGKPVAMLMMARNATVTICHSKTRNLNEITARADLIVSTAGVLALLKKEALRPGQVVIDVSVNWDPEKNGGKGGMAGDVLFEEAEPIVEAITPVPGGVGSVTTAVLLSHLVKSCSEISE
ncbi:MAG: bifunctional 5,10-methylenetetrahydrofolate dehydrogenase/5,10-methenyltetrahydrofolate cyclohydrolase [Lachnospiraceae bacterium]|nr:bifunctional 5,10-methylenetetrahydrofolate dehydrogenase/5,10-methenyltetrahydrofolate cyclohydrolase [Lachnospiraceae bacterium]